MAEIDVVMSVYNADRYLPYALEGIQNQTVRDINIIVVDDGSTDCTRGIVVAAQAQDPRIVYHYQDNAGIVAAVNAGMKLCTSSFIARHDGDDISYPWRFERQIAYLHANPDCVAVSALARHVNEQGLPIGSETRIKDMSSVDDSSIPANEPYILQPLLMMRREAFSAANGYRLLSVAEDTDLYWRMMQYGNLHILPEVLGDYRIHGSSISSHSIISGRRMAAWTQLSALSAQRVRKGLPDIEFTVELRQQIDTQDEMIDLYRVVRPLLEGDETQWFYSAMAAKLVEICYYRPFEPLRTDIEYIRSADRIDRNLIYRKFYDVYEEGVLSAGIRLAAAGNVYDAVRIVPRHQWAKLFGRTIFRKILSKKTRRSIKLILRR